MSTVSTIKLLMVLVLGMAAKRTVLEINTRPQMEFVILLELFLIGILAFLFWNRRRGGILDMILSHHTAMFELSVGALECSMIFFIMYVGQFGIPAWLTMLSLCVIFFVVIFLVMFLLNDIRLSTKQRQLSMELRNQMIEFQLSQIKQEYEWLQKKNHERNRERQFLFACLKDGEIQKAQSALEKKIGAQQTQKKVWTGNALLDFLISIRAKEMKEKEIDFHFFADIQILPVSEEDACILLGNLLDNAMEAASLCSVERRWIRLKLQMQGQMFVLSLSNASSRLPKRKGKRFLSSKTGSAHGWGLENVQEMVGKYDGTIDFAYNEQQFEVKLLLQEAHIQEAQ